MSRDPARLDPRERDYLCGVLRAVVQREAPPPPPPELNWARLHRVLMIDRLVPVFHLYAEGVEPPPAYVDAWQRYTLAMIRKNRVDANAAVKLFDRLDAAGIPAVGLRGLGLAQRVYADPMLRPVRDVDLLVPRDSRDALVALLHERGAPFDRSRDGLVCDVDGSRIAIRWHAVGWPFAASLDLEALISRREPLETEQGRIWALPPGDELVGVVCNGVLRHDMDTLLEVLDVALLCERCEIDWRDVADRAAAARLETVFGFALGLVDHLLGTDYRRYLPAGRAPGPGDPFFDSYTARMFGTDTRTYWLARLVRGASLADTPGDRLRMLARHLRASELWRLARPRFDRRDATLRLPGGARPVGAARSA